MAFENERLSEWVIWYVEHHHELIDHHDQFLAEVNLTQLSGMRYKTKREWVCNPGIARNAW